MKISPPNHVAIKLTAVALVEMATKTYAEPSERAALRCALGDAAGLLDKIADEIGRRNRARGGRIRADAVAAIGLITSCANEISAMRDLVRVNAR